MKSLRKAINAKCKDCIYDPLAGGTWRQQVVDCPVTSCPLWPVRPKRTPSAQKALSPEKSNETLQKSGKHATSGTTPQGAA